MYKPHTLKSDNLACSWQNKIIFQKISFEVQSGELLFIQGQNGSGKSSLLKLLVGLTTPAQGNIFWNNRSLQTARTDFLENLHYIGHTNGIKLGLTVIENLKLMQHLALSSLLKIEEVLTVFHLDKYQHTLANHLSAGQKRKLALAKLWLLPKPVWILDEPFTALDTSIQSIFLSQLENHLSEKGMAIISSHHPITLNNPIKMLSLDAGSVC